VDRVQERPWGLDDPLFPATQIEHGPDRQFKVGGLARKHWSNAGTIRAIFKQAFEAIELPGFNPHSFRHALAMLGERTCQTPEEFKAWSQNLGHEQVLTTFQKSDLQDLAQRLAEFARGEANPGRGAASIAAMQDVDVLL
jgi:integrase